MPEVDQLFSIYHAHVFGVACHIMEDAEKAADATMQVFEKIILRGMPESVQNIASWLHIITRNHCISILRQEKKVTKMDQEWANMEITLHPFQESEATKLFQSENDTHERLNECLDLLPPLQKQCLLLFYNESWTYQRIAEHLQSDISQVKSHLQNGKKNLRKKLLQEFPQKKSDEATS